jgi:hypothetical protein
MIQRSVTGTLIAPLSRLEKLIRSGDYEGAAAVLRSRLERDRSDHFAWYRLATVENFRRRFRDALNAVEQALSFNAKERTYLRLKGIVLSNLGAHAHAVRILEPLAKDHPRDLLTLSPLQVSYFRSGERDEAIELGKRILRAEDEAAGSDSSNGDPRMPSEPSGGRNKRLISFSLWGSNPIYCCGAAINVRLARYIYPGWICRFYIGHGVPAAAVRALEQGGAEIVDAPKGNRHVPPAFWRFLAADDPEVGAYICRDCDSRLSPKEAAAVDRWLHSGRSFHVMRDHVIHRNIMLAGLWGGHTRSPLQMGARITRWLSRSTDERYGADQAFLAQQVWPAIRTDCLVHDSYYSLFGAEPFPVFGKGDDQNHVGMSIVSEERVRSEARSFGLSWP